VDWSSAVTVAVLVIFYLIVNMAVKGEANHSTPCYYGNEGELESVSNVTLFLCLVLNNAAVFVL